MKLINNKINLMIIKLIHNHIMIPILILNISISHKIQMLMIKLKRFNSIYLNQKAKHLLIKNLWENRLMIL